VEAIADDHARLMGWAREEDPDAQYLLNEYGLVAGETEPLPVTDQEGRPVTRDRQARRMVELAEAMKARGQAPDALGLQTAPGEWEKLGAFRDTLDLLGETGLPVHVTEFRANLKPLEASGLEGKEREELLADYLETAVRVCFAHPSCEGFYLWDTGVLHNGRKPTATWERFRNLLQDRWRTRLSGETDEDGRLRFRGFHGDYRIRLPRERGQSGYATELRPGGGSPDVQEIRLPYGS
jgi:GH35 family endo-1,4-beta-xylanase